MEEGRKKHLMIVFGYLLLGYGIALAAVALASVPLADWNIVIWSFIFLLFGGVFAQPGGRCRWEIAFGYMAFGFGTALAAKALLSAPGIDWGAAIWSVLFLLWGGAFIQGGHYRPEKANKRGL